MQAGAIPTQIKIRASDRERTYFRLWLQSQLMDRCKRNPRYSLRSFAKSLGHEASSLSQILSGKRPVSKKKMLQICEQLFATPDDLRAFGLTSDPSARSNDYYQISLDAFSVMSNWYHYAIMELTSVVGFKSDPKWIARKLSITTEETKSAIERLLRRGLLLQKDQSLSKSKKLYTNRSNISTSGAHRELQKQLVNKALLAIDNCRSEEKDITSMTMAIDVANLDLAREVISRFRGELCELLETGRQSRVYNLTVQLYPVSESEEEKL